MAVVPVRWPILAASVAVVMPGQFALDGAPGHCQTRPRRQQVELVGQCAYLARATRPRPSPGSTRRGTLLAAGNVVKLLAAEGRWARVAQVSEKDCFGKPAPPAAGWLPLGALAPNLLISTAGRPEPPKLKGKALFALNRKTMVLSAFGRRSPSLDLAPSAGHLLWTTRDRSYPYLFHTPGSDDGPGSLTLFGPARMLSLASPGARFTMTVGAKAFRIHSDHLCLSLVLELRVQDLVKHRGWPPRLEIEQIRVYQPDNQVKMLDLLARRRRRDKSHWPIFTESLTVDPARPKGAPVRVAKDTPFRPRAVVLRQGDSGTEPYLEVQLVPSGELALLGQRHVAVTTLHVACGG